MRGVAVALCFLIGIALLPLLLPAIGLGCLIRHVAHRTLADPAQLIIERWMRG